MLIYKDAVLRRKLLKISIPAMSEMVLYMIIGVVDTMVVGRLGAAPLAAVGLGAEVFFAIILLVVALSIGVSVLVAQAWGAGKKEYAAQVAGKGIALGVGAGLLTAILGLLFSDNLLSLFPLEKSVYIQALAYLQVAFWISPLAIVYYMVNSIFRGMGRTDLPMKIAVVTNVINCLGDYILVYGKLGMPALGVAGAAWATSIAHITGFLLALYILFSGRSSLRIEVKYIFTGRFDIVKSIIRLGLPGLLEDFFRKSADIIAMFFIVFLGTLAFASHEVALIVESVSFMPGIGVAIAASVMVGHAIGARDKEQALLVSRGCLELGMTAMGFLGLIFAFFPYFIASLFTNDPAIISTAGFLIRLAAFEQLTIAATSIMEGIIKGSGDTRTPLLITSFFTWFIRLPALYVMTHILVLPITYIWGLFVTDWLLRAAVFASLYKKRQWLEKSLSNPLIGEPDVF